MRKCRENFAVKSDKLLGKHERGRKKREKWFQLRVFLPFSIHPKEKLFFTPFRAIEYKLLGGEESAHMDSIKERFGYFRILWNTEKVQRMYLFLWRVCPRENPKRAGRRGSGRTLFGTFPFLPRVCTLPISGTTRKL